MEFGKHLIDAPKKMTLGGLVISTGIKHHSVQDVSGAKRFYWLAIVLICNNNSAFKGLFACPENNAVGSGVFSYMDNSG